MTQTDCCPHEAGVGHRRSKKENQKSLQTDGGEGLTVMCICLLKCTLEYVQPQMWATAYTALYQSKGDTAGRNAANS